MNAVERIADNLQRVYSGDAWHGPSVVQVLEGIDARQAAKAPAHGGHAIWQIVLHMAAWTEEVRRRLDGQGAALSSEEDWPAIGEVSQAGWKSAQARLDQAQHRLLESLNRFDPARLDSVYGAERSPAAGSGVTYYILIQGLIEHHVYHAGQIALLKKM